MKHSAFKIGVIFSLLISLSITSFIGLSVPGQVKAVTYDDLLKAQEEKKRLEQQLESQKNTSRSLEDQIAYMDNQIRLTELEIRDTQGQIQATQNHLAETNGKIDDLNRKLGVLDETVKQMQEVAEARIRDSYKKSRMPEFSVLVGAESFSGVMKTYQYLKELEAEDARVLAQISQNMENYGEQKANLEKLKSEKEDLKMRLEDEKRRAANQQQELDQVKGEKNALLADSETSESRYRQLLAENEARIASMRRILAGNGLGGQSLGYFNRGDLIGREGSTGCSTGSHLHYSYLVGGAFVNPWPYFTNGSLRWPEDGGVGDNVTQWYSYYHNGIDIARGEGSPLYATKAGHATLEIAYSKQEILNSSWCPGWAKPYVRDNQWEIWLRHSDGTISIYAHVLPY